MAFFAPSNSTGIIMKNKETKVCIHYLSCYLPITENWIYTILTNLKIFTPVVLTRKIINRHLFQLDRIYSLNSLTWFRAMGELVLFKIFRFIPFFYYISKENNGSIIHVHFGNHGIKSLGLQKKLKIPMICSFYGADAFKITNSVKVRKAYQKMFIQVDKVLVLGEYMKRELMNLGCPERKLLVHHLGIDTDKITFLKRIYPEKRPVRFLLASSFVAKKGIEDTLNALGVISAKFDFTVEIIGDGPLKTEVLTLIDRNGLKEKTILHGYQIYDFFIQRAYECDIFLQASKTTSLNDKEGTPMSIVDAMATGMPVVATKHSDIPEIVIDNYNGYLALENNYLDFARCLEKILNMGNFTDLSINARKHVEKHFNALEQNRKLEELYSCLVDKYQY
jgi:colanic acid/amylovoran biosynthesis glycosyltransferase